MAQLIIIFWHPNIEIIKFISTSTRMKQTRDLNDAFRKVNSLIDVNEALSDTFDGIGTRKGWWKLTDQCKFSNSEIYYSTSKNSDKDPQGGCGAGNKRPPTGQFILMHLLL